MEWYSDFTNIQGLAISGNSLFLLYSDNKVIAKMKIKPLLELSNPSLTPLPNDPFQNNNRMEDSIISTIEVPSPSPSPPPPLISTIPTTATTTTTHSANETSTNTQTETTNSNSDFPEASLAITSTLDSSSIVFAKPIKKKKKKAKIPEILSPNSVAVQNSVISQNNILPKSTSDLNLLKLSSSTPASSAINNSNDSKSTHKRNKSATEREIVKLEEIPLVIDPMKPGSPSNTNSTSNSFKNSIKEIKLFSEKVGISKGLEEFKQIMKDPFKDDKKQQHQETTQQSLSPLLSANNNDISKQMSSFHILTKSTFESLSIYRQHKDKSIESVLSFILHWLTIYDAQSSSSSPANDVPNSWLTEIITSYIELKLSKDYEFKLSSQEVLVLLNKYIEYVHTARILASCNQLKYTDCVTYLCTKELEKLTKSGVAQTMEDALNKRDGINSLNLLRSSNSLSLFIHYFDKLLELVPNNITDYCISNYPMIQPWNLDRLRSINLNLYTHYLLQLMNLYSNCRKDADLVELCFECCLVDCNVSTDILYQDNRLPKRNAHLLNWKHNDILLNIINNPKSYSFNPTHLKLSCENAGYFPGLIKLYINSNQIRKCINYLVELDDRDSLEQLMQSITQLSEWKYLIGQVDNTRNRNTNETNWRITLPNIVELMLLTIGLEDSLHILLEFNQLFTDNNATMPFFKSFIQKGHNESTLKHTTNLLLEHLDTYLWSQKNPYLSIQHNNTLQKEICAHEIPHINFATYSALPSYWENCKNHWGVSTAPLIITSCYYCTLPIKNNISSNCVTFTCGHVYHESCVKNNICFLCKSSVP